MLSHILAPDAFAPLPEQKQPIYHDYKKLYPDTPLVTQYHCERKQETKAQANARSEFQKQFLALLDAYKKWGNENQCATPASHDQINKLKTNIFDAAYSGNQTSEYFSSMKQNLEKIWFILSIEQKNTPLEKKQKAYQDLCASLSVCAPGVYTRIEDILNSLTTDISLERWLSEARTHFIRQYADKHVIKYNIYAGNSVHVYNAFLVYALNEGWAPLSNVTKIADPFIAAHTNIDEKEVELFFNEFARYYTPEEIIRCVATNFFYHYNQLVPSEKKDDWVPATPELLKKITELANTVGMAEINFCDLSEDCQSLRFNLNVFKALFLKTCKANKKIFREELWNQISLGKHNLYYYLGNPTVSWFENPAQELMDWNKIFIETNTHIQMANLMTHAKQEDIALIAECYNTSLDAKNKKGNTLSNLAMCQLEPSMRNKLLTTPEYKAVELIQPIKKNFNLRLDKNNKHMCYQLLRDAVQQGDIDLLTYLITEQKLTPEKYFSGKSENLFFIKIRRNTAQIVKILSETKLNINESNDRGMTPIHEALLSTYEHEKVAALAECKADINSSRDPLGRTPFFFAFDTLSNIATLKCLLEAKADINQKNKHGKTAVQLVVDLRKDAYLRVAGFRLERLKLLAEYKANLNILDEKGSTPAQTALEQHDYEMITTLAEAKADLNTPNSKGETLAHIALSLSNPSNRHNTSPLHINTFLENLAKYNFDFTRKNSAGVSPIVIAVKEHNVKALLIMHRVKMPNIQNWTITHAITYLGDFELLKLTVLYLDNPNCADVAPIHIAASQGNADFIQALAERKANLNIPCTKGNTAAHLAAQSGHTNVIHKLAAYKADLSRTNNYNETPIFCALGYSTAKESDRYSVVEALIEYKASLHTTDVSRQTLPKLAAMNGYKDIIKLLFANKADFEQLQTESNVGNNIGYMPIHLAAIHLAVIHSHDEVIRMLAEYKVNLDTKDAYGMTPLHHAALSGNIKTFETLVESKANLSIVCNKGNTVAHYAAQKGKTEILKTLFNKKFDLNQRNTSGSDGLNAGATPAHFAAKNGHESTMDLLAECKANLASKDEKGFTPAHFVINEDYPLITYKLKKYNIALDSAESQNNEGVSPIGLAIQQGKWHLLVILLMNMKDKDLSLANKTILIKKYREELTSAYSCESHVALTPTERMRSIGQIIRSENCLGTILNHSNQWFRFLSSKPTMPRKISQIIAEFKYKPELEEKTQPLQEVKPQPGR